MTTGLTVDSHAYCFAAFDAPAGHADSAEHLRWVQAAHGWHHQPAWRLRDHAPASSRPLQARPGAHPADVPEVGFRVDHDAGRVVWTVEGEDYTKAWLPPGLVGCRYSPAQLIAEMDYAGVDVALLHTDPTLGRGAAFQRECVRAHPTRLHSMAPVDEWRIAADPDTLAAEVTHAISGLGLHAVKLIPPLAYLGSEQPWDDGPYRPFWEAVAALQVPVFFTMGSGPRQLVAPQSTDEAVSGYLEEQRVLMRWLERYPQIDCALTHGFPYRSFVEGTSIRLPPEIWEPFESPRLRLEVCFAVRLGDLFDYPYAPTQPVLEDMLRRIGADRLMCGTDMPFQNRFCTYRQSRVSLEEHCGFLSDHECSQLLGRHGRGDAGPGLTGSDAGGACSTAPPCGRTTSAVPMS